MKKRQTIYKRGFGATLVFNCLIICWVVISLATFTEGAEENPWRFSTGGGGYVQNVYPGSDETFTTGLSYVTAAYSKGRYGAALSLIDGVNLMYNVPDKPLTASIKINSGDERDSGEYSTLFMSKDHSNEVKDLLEETPTVTTDVTSEFKLDYMTSMGILGFALEYHPTSVEGAKDRFYNGFVLALTCAKPLPITSRLSLMGVAGISLMDENFADAWFSLETPTRRLNAFDANAGLKDVQLSMQLQYAQSKRMDLVFLAKNAWFLADAGKSPFTKSTYQMTWAFFGVYNF